MTRISLLTLQMFLICEILFVLGSGLIKASFALTLLRIVPTGMQRIGLFVLIAITGVMTVATSAIIFTTCRPVEFLWTQFESPPAQGNCHGFATQIKFNYAHGAIMLFIDVTLGLIVPIYLLSSLQMPWRVKMSAGLLLSLGSL